MLTSTVLEFGIVMAFGLLPTVVPGSGLTLTVCSTSPVAVSISEMLSLLELATMSVPSLARYSADGSRPTLICLVCWPVTRLTSDTVPVEAAPVTLLATMFVPAELLVYSPSFAGRPPSLETNALVPDSTTWRGALPTLMTLTSWLVAVSMTPSLLTTLSATYSLVPSELSAMPEGPSGTVVSPVVRFTIVVSSGMTTGVPTVPFAFTGKWTRSEVCGNHSDFPSADHSGPSAATVPSPMTLG